MKRKWKALASLCLALAMMLCLSLPVWAEGTPKITQDTKGSITLSWENDDSGNTDYDDITVAVYKVINVNYEYATSVGGYEAPKNPEFYWDNAKVQSWVKTYDTNNNKEYIGEDNSVTQNFINLASDDTPPASADEIKSFVDQMAAAIRADGEGKLDIQPVTTVQTEPGTTENKVTLSNLEMGAYLVLIEGGVKIYSPAFVSIVPKWDEGTNSWNLSTLNKNVTLKSTVPTITKTVYDGNGLVEENYADDKSKYAQVKIGDTITYMLVADVPQFPASATATGFQISDDLPEGIQLVDGSVKVYGVENLNNLGNELTKDIYYTLTTSGATRPDVNKSPVSFNINFAGHYNEIKPYSKIRVVYQATINKDIKIVDTNNQDVNRNIAYLDYNNNPYEKTAEGETLSWQSDSDTATVYTYGIKVDKKSGEADENAKLLPGAEFELKDSDGSKISFFDEGNGVYHVVASGTQGAGTTLTVGSGQNAGKLTLKGLDVGTYTLTETKAPDGYVLPSNSFEIKIEDDGILNNQDNNAPNGKTEYKETTAEGTTENENDSGYVSLEVLNYHGFSLPTTGGMGTVLFTAAGIALMGVGLAALVLFLRRRSDK